MGTSETEAEEALVVSGSAVLRDGLAESLEVHGWPVHRVRTGADAIRIAEHGNLVIAVVELSLPDMTGQRVVERLHELWGLEAPNTYFPAIGFRMGEDEPGIVLRAYDEIMDTPWTREVFQRAREAMALPPHPTRH